MSDQTRSGDKEPSSGNRSRVGMENIDDSHECKMQPKGWLKGIVPMAICCAVPLLVLAAIPLLGLKFGWLADDWNGLLRFGALLACPVGMFFMMRMMTKDK